MDKIIADDSANRSCRPSISATMTLTTTRTIMMGPASISRRSSNKRRYLPASQANKHHQQEKDCSSVKQFRARLGSSSVCLLGLVIILSCFSPSIMSVGGGGGLSLAEAAELTPGAASAFDFTINSSIGPAGESAAADVGSRSLPYISAASSGSAGASSSSFDPSSYKNIHEAIRNHPDLREVS